jgi:uncharacterized iron-regulated membrane protein
MRFWDIWVQHPQTVPLRRGIFLLHRWTGIAIGLYILVLSLSGSLIVYRDELSLAFTRPPVLVTSQGRRLTLPELQQAALQSFPGYAVTDVFWRPDPRRAVEVTLERGRDRHEELFDPYTGADLGNRFNPSFRALMWLVELHDNLLLGRTGRAVSGVGALLFTLIVFTGSVIWWPGLQNWRRSLKIDWQAGPKRLFWSIHSVVGFWLFLFVLLWAVSGVYLCFPRAFNVVVNFIHPADPSSDAIRLSDTLFAALAAAHFGRFGGKFTKTIWVIAGLAPATLFLTGTVMWWNRVVRSSLRRWE